MATLVKNRFVAIQARLNRRRIHFWQAHDAIDDDEGQTEEEEAAQATISTVIASTVSSLPSDGEAAKQRQRSTRRPPWSFILRTMLCGTRDTASPLYLLAGFEDTLLRYIYDITMASWTDHVTSTLPAYSVGRIRPWDTRFDDEQPEESGVLFETADKDGQGRRLTHVVVHGHCQYAEVGRLVVDRPQIAFSPCGRLQFPTPHDINVNMLPFILGDKSSLPDELLPYYPLIEKCPVMEEEMGKVCYLTVSESYVNEDATQRRSGLHIEAPRVELEASNFVAGQEHHWGCGVAYSPDELHGGLYMASNVSNTCAVYNALIDKNGVDSQGGMNHLRRLIGEPTLLEANELVWLTDCTPHEALPQEGPGYRQFFRLVTSKISLWYQGNSTANPKVALPDYVQLILGSKFDQA